MEGQLSGKKVLLIVPPLSSGRRRCSSRSGYSRKKVRIWSWLQRTPNLPRNTRRCDRSNAGDGRRSAASFDAIVLAGGLSVPDFFWKDEKLAELVTEMSEAGKIVAAISLSTVVLAKAKLLEGREATVYYLPEALDELKAGGATYVEKKLIVDGNLIMAEGPGAVSSFTSASFPHWPNKPSSV